MGADVAGELLERFWQALSDVRTGMLEVTGGEPRSQPMTAHFEGRDGPVWFYARKDALIVSEAQGADGAVFHYAGRGHDLYACVHGSISVSEDRAAAQRFWSEEVARWYPGGQDDPQLVLLKFEPSKAQIWEPSGGGQASHFSFGAGGRPKDVRAEVQL